MLEATDLPHAPNLPALFLRAPFLQVELKRRRDVRGLTSVKHTSVEMLVRKQRHVHEIRAVLERPYSKVGRKSLASRTTAEH